MEENQETSKFSKADVERFRKMLNQLEESNTTSAPNSFRANI